MTEEKMRLIFQAMDGITYLEWKKLKHCIDAKFNAEASIASNKIIFAGADEIIETYKREI